MWFLCLSGSQRVALPHERSSSTSECSRNLRGMRRPHLWASQQQWRSQTQAQAPPCKVEFNEPFLKRVPKFAARGPNMMLNTANAPSKPTTTPTTVPTRRATTARLFSFNTYLPDTLVHYAPECVEGEFSEVRLERRPGPRCFLHFGAAVRF